MIHARYVVNESLWSFNRFSYILDSLLDDERYLEADAPPHAASQLKGTKWNDLALNLAWKIKMKLRRARPKHLSQARRDYLRKLRELCKLREASSEAALSLGHSLARSPARPIKVRRTILVHLT